MGMGGKGFNSTAGVSRLHHQAVRYACRVNCYMRGVGWGHKSTYGSIAMALLESVEFIEYINKRCSTPVELTTICEGWVGDTRALLESIAIALLQSVAISLLESIDGSTSGAPMLV